MTRFKDGLAEARALMERAVAQVEPIMKRRCWRVCASGMG